MLHASNTSSGCEHHGTTLSTFFSQCSACNVHTVSCIPAVASPEAGQKFQTGGKAKRLRATGNGRIQTPGLLMALGPRHEKIARRRPHLQNFADPALIPPGLACCQRSLLRHLASLGIYTGRPWEGSEDSGFLGRSKSKAFALHLHAAGSGCHLTHQMNLKDTAGADHHFEPRCSELINACLDKKTRSVFASRSAEHTLQKIRGNNVFQTALLSCQESFAGPGVDGVDVALPMPVAGCRSFC